MDESEKLRGMDQLYQLLLSFQCQRVPFDLISRASEPRLSWSATGEIEQIQPHEGGVPRWLLDLREAHQWPFDHDEGAAAPNHDGLRLVNDCGVWYFEVQPTDSLDVDEYEQSQEAYASQCVCIFNHAFPCRNTEVLGEEVAARLMPLAKTFLLPLLASVSENDIQDWLLPKESADQIPAARAKQPRNISFAISLFDCLLQVLASLGPHSPLYPASFPRKMVNAINTPMTQVYTARDHRVEPCLTVVLELSETISSSEAEIEAFEKLASHTACGDLDERSNAWVGLALIVLLSSQAATRLQPKALSDAITKAAGSWYPKSTTSLSPMEYLVAIELLPHAQLRTISLPESLRVNTGLNILRGLLLSRMQYYDEASRVLYDTMPAAISYWGIESFQVGIVAAESANCYNMLRKEDVANTIATRCLAARSTPELIGRQDWFYLSLYLVDSLIGSGKYEEAESVLEHLVSQRPITPAIHMMGCLRLSKIRRRVSTESGTIGFYHSLREGLGLFRQVPSALREEYLEEAACGLSAAVTTTQGSLGAQETLIDDINAVIGQACLRESPAQKRYSQAQLEFKQQALRQENSIVPGLDIPRADSITLADDAVSHASTTSSSTIDDTTTYMATQRVFSIPHEENRGFIMRPEVEMKIDLLNFDDDAHMHVYSIHGEAGIGKTAFITDLAYTLQSSCPAIIWIKDDPLDEICDNLRKCAMQLELQPFGSSRPIRQDPPLEQVFKWFQTPRSTFGGPWTIVFDGIESEQVLDQIWPHGGSFGNVIVITRKVPSLPTMSNITSIKLEQLDLTKAMELAYYDLSESRIPRRPSGITPRTYKTKDLHSLVNLLDCHPAAIKAAASLMSQDDMSIRNFVSAFKQVQSSCLSLPAMNEIRRQPNHSLHLITIWLIRSRGSEHLMNVISLLSGLEIKERFLWPNDELIKTSEYPLTVKDFEKMRDQLLESTLIWRSRRHTICTSTTVQAILRERMDPESFRDACCRALLLLNHSWPCKFEDLPWTDYSVSTHMKCSDLWPHVFSLAELFTHSPLTRPHFVLVEMLEAILNISCCGVIRNDYNNANLFPCLADDFCDELLSFHTIPGQLSLKLARQRCLLNHHRGRLAYRQGLHQEARAHFKRSFVIAVQELEPGSEDYWFIQATAHQGLGDVHRKTDDFEAAIASYEMSIKALIHVEEKYGQYLSAVRASLGLSLLLNEQLEAAESVLEQVRPPSSATSVEGEVSSLSRSPLLFLGLAIAKLVQNKAEESLQLALECLSNSRPPFRQEFVFHLVVSISYGRLSKFGPALEHLDRARRAFGSDGTYSVELSALREQNHAFGLMRQGTWGSLELQKLLGGWGYFFDEPGFLNMHFFATHVISYLSRNL